ncbi:MAG TPA: hypothetical protein PLS53_18495, partial [Thermoanaerobaculaceae bacterium]|nr:hypothetical protein [Thermoanaerobaculaceae bacterium]
MRPRVPLGAGRAVPACLFALWLAAPVVPARAADVDAVAERASQSVVTVFAQRTLERPVRQTGQTERRTRTRVGSGVAVEADVVLTTASVVKGAERVLV